MLKRRSHSILFLLFVIVQFFSFLGCQKLNEEFVPFKLVLFEGGDLVFLDSISPVTRNGLINAFQFYNVSYHQNDGGDLEVHKNDWKNIDLMLTCTSAGLDSIWVKYHPLPLEMVPFKKVLFINDQFKLADVIYTINDPGITEVLNFYRISYQYDKGGNIQVAEGLVKDLPLNFELGMLAADSLWVKNNMGRNYKEPHWP